MTRRDENLADARAGEAAAREPVDEGLQIAATDVAFHW
jgi:hypothetical protein